MALIDFQEGRNYAIAMIESVHGMPNAMFAIEGGLETVLHNLEESMKNKPDSYAAGIESVLIAVRKAKK